MVWRKKIRFEEFIPPRHSILGILLTMKIFEISSLFLVYIEKKMRSFCVHFVYLFILSEGTSSE